MLLCICNSNNLSVKKSDSDFGGSPGSECIIKLMMKKKKKKKNSNK